MDSIIPENKPSDSDDLSKLEELASTKCGNCSFGDLTLEKEIICRLNFDFPYQGPIIDENDKCESFKESNSDERLTFLARLTDNYEYRPPLINTKAFFIYDEQKKKEVLQVFQVANAIITLHKIVTFRDDQSMYYYDPKRGVYVSNAKFLIEEEVQHLLEGTTNESIVREVLGHIKRSTGENRIDFIPPKHLINFRNGIYNTKTKELAPHSSKFYSLNQIPRIYDPNAKCPLFDKFLEEILPNEGSRRIIWELLGYLLIPDYSIQRIFIFVGEGANAKGTLMNFIKELIGERNCESIALHDLKNQEARAELFNKLVNFDWDIEFKALANSSWIKKLSGGDDISARHLYQKRFNFKNNARIIGSCNLLPPSYDTTRGFLRRLIFIVFNQYFRRENKDREMLEKITTEEEMSGVLNKALLSLEELLTQGDFSYYLTEEENAILYKNLSNPTYYYLNSCVLQTKDINDWIHRTELYEEFIKFCEDKGLPKTTKGEFWKKTREHFGLGEIGEKKKGKKPNNKIAFLGLRLLNPKEVEEKKKSDLEGFLE